MEGKLEISLVEKGRINRRRKRRARGSKAGCKIYVGHLPDAFDEVQLRDYFKQFGNVIGVYIPRSEKSGRAKGCGFVEFPDPMVAKIASEAMNNYLMFDKLLKCRVIDEAGGSLAGKHWASKDPSNKAVKHAAIQNRSQRSLKSVQKQQNRLREKLIKKNKSMEKMCLDYKFPVPTASDLAGSLRDVTAASQYSMLLDSDEDEIIFKAPPQSTKKALKRSLVVTPTASPLGVQADAKPLIKKEDKPAKTPTRKSPRKSIRNN